MNMSIQKKISLSKNIFFVIFASIFRQCLSFCSGIIVARILLPQDFGIISMAATFSGLIDVFSRFGFEAFIISRQDISKKEINSVYLSNILVGLIAVIIVIIGAPLVAHIYKTPEVKYILVFSALLFLINSFTSIPRALLIKEMRQDIISKIEIVQSFLNVTLIIIFALLGYRYLSYVIPLVISNLIVCAIYLNIIKWKFSILLNKNILKQAFNYGKSFLPKTILSFFVYNSDYIIIGYLLGPILLGYYSFGFDKASILSGLLTSLHCNMFFPLFSKFQSDSNELRKAFFSYAKRQTFILYPLIFIQIILAKELIGLVYGTKWNNSILTFQLILGYIFARITASIIHVLFDAVDRPEQNLKHFQIITPVCILALITGIKLGGLTGIAIAAFIVHILGALLLFIRTCRIFKWNFKEFILNLSECFIPLVLQLPVIIPLKGYLNHINLPNYLILLIIIPTSFVLYLFFASLFLKDIYENFILSYSRKLLIKLKSQFALTND